MKASDMGNSTPAPESTGAPFTRWPWTRRAFLRAALVGGTGLALPPRVWARESARTVARGTVYHDRDGDDRRGSDDPGIPGVAVSNGCEVVLTDERGRWQLPVEGESTTFLSSNPGTGSRRDPPITCPGSTIIISPRVRPSNGSPACSPLGRCRIPSISRSLSDPNRNGSRPCSAATLNRATFAKSITWRARWCPKWLVPRQASV